MPARAQALVLERPGPVSADGPLVGHDRPLPDPAAGEVRIAVSACGVCRTDLQLVEGDLGAHVLPIVPGHQIVGRIDARGPGVDPSAHVLGARVGVAWIADACGRCALCRSGRENLCEQGRFTGWDRDGGFATHVTARADFTYALPEATDDIAAAPLLCGGAIGYRSLHIAGIDLADAQGRRLGLFGFGASARCVIQLAVDAGCEVFVATRRSSEQAAALELGAAWAGDTFDRPPVELDAAITFAPVGDVVRAALATVGRGATVAINAIHLDRIPELDYDRLWHERVLRSVANVTRADVVGFLERAAAIPIRTSADVVGLSDANRALARLRDGDVSGAAVLVPD